MDIIQNLNELIVVAMTGPNVNWRQFGHVRAVYNGDLVLFNYTPEAEYENSWNWFERNSRGLILNWKTGEIVARPFEKFWNFGQGGRYPKGHLVTVTEKIDGSLGIIYRDNGWKVATRGSFESDQAKWATKWLNENVDLTGCPDEYTILCEIVYPENRIVCEYATSGLYLLAIRNRFTGDYLPYYPDVYQFWYDFKGFVWVAVYNFNSVTDIIAATDTLSASCEGWVAEFSNGQRFKFKGDRYRELHKIVTNLTFNRILQRMIKGNINTLFHDAPEEFWEQINEHKNLIEARVAEFEQMVESAFASAPKESRRKFAKWTKANCPSIAVYMFLKFDGRCYRKLIMKREF